MEAELRGPAPREVSFAGASPEVAELLRSGVAARAWITERMRWRDDGIEVRVRLAFEHGGRIVRGHRSYSLDAYHAYVGSPEYMRWLDVSMVGGGTFTVLFPPGDPEAFLIYGDLELRLSDGSFAAR